MIFPGDSKGAVIGSRPYSIGRRGLPRQNGDVWREGFCEWGAVMKASEFFADRALGLLLRAVFAAVTAIF